jgi:hypothetical protein
MTHIKVTFLALFFSLTGFGQNSTNTTSKDSFAVLELFTSEGCSSCPKADELMGKFQKEFGNQPVYILSYHVDYWDRDGWKDIFSNAEYTKRQYSYVRWLQKEPIYTPQLIINGKLDYVGSQEKNIRTGIAKALSKPATVNLDITSQQGKSWTVVNYKVSGNVRNTVLVFALIQKLAKSKVKNGENEGKLLSHYQIVRNTISQRLTIDGKGTTNLYFPKNFKAQNAEIIGFIQDSTTGAILGAAKVNL